MKIASDVTLKRIDDKTTGKRAITIDLTDDLFTDTKGFLEILYSFREHYIHKPVGIWLNINQAYVLAVENILATDNNLKPEELAYQLETFMGYKIWIKGRDA